MNALLKDLPPEISPEAEQSLLALGRNEDIVLAAIRPAFAYLKRISRGRLPEDELLSAAYAALAKAVKNFKPGQQRFIYYARPYLRGELAAEWRRKDAVRGASKHETPLEEGKYPAPLESESVEPEFNAIHWAETWKIVEPVIRKTLTPIEIRILEFRYRFSYTLEATGEEIGKSRERIRQIEQKALQKLRAALSNRGDL